MALDTQETANSFGDEIDYVSRTTKLAYIRLNVEQGMQDIGLEEWKEFETITGATNHYLNNHKAEIEVLLVKAMRRRYSSFLKQALIQTYKQQRNSLHFTELFVKVMKG